MTTLGDVQEPPAPAALLDGKPRDPVPADAPEIPERVLRARSGWVAVDWRELVAGRELLFFLVWRDIKVRYKQTALGAAWAVLQPLSTMAIFAVIFGRLAGMPSEGVPYPLFVFAGLMPWMFFAGGVASAGQSLVNQQQLLTKIYFPRLFIPTASVGALAVDLVITLAIYAVMLVGYQTAPSWRVVFLPGVLLLTVVATLGVGYLLAALTVLYRDLRYVVPFLIQILMYASPVIYPAALLPRRYHPLLALNPMFGIVEAYRSVILGTPWEPAALAVSSASAAAVFVLGVCLFRRTERRFADIA